MLQVPTLKQSMPSGFSLIKQFMPTSCEGGAWSWCHGCNCLLVCYMINGRWSHQDINSTVNRTRFIPVCNDRLGSFCRSSKGRLFKGCDDADFDLFYRDFPPDWQWRTVAAVPLLPDRRVQKPPETSWPGRHIYWKQAFPCHIDYELIISQAFINHIQSTIASVDMFYNWLTNG